MPAKFEIFGDDAGVPCPARSRHKSRDQKRKNSREQQFPPAFRAAKTKNRAHFFQVGGNRDGTRDYVEQDVPLRPQQQQQDRADSQSAARAYQQQQNNRKKRGSGHGSRHLGDRLRDGGKFRFQPDEDSHWNGPQRGEKQSESHAQEGRARSQEYAAQFLARQVRQQLHHLHGLVGESR